MPEGLDQARDLFHNAIEPSATRPRDESGRFTAASGRPEPIFEERPFEGEAASDDRSNRDGPDTRDEGSRQRLQRVPKDERGDAAGVQGDDRRAATEQAGDDEQEGGDDQHGQDQEPGEPAEGPPEPESEGEKWQVIHNGKPVEQIEVNVDGQPTQVSFDECVKGYIKNQTFHQRMSQVDQARQQVDQYAHQVEQGREVYSQKLQYLDKLIADMTPVEPDWDAEFRADPITARSKQVAYGEIYQKRYWIDQQLQQERQQAQAQYDAKSKEYAVNQFTQFVQETGIPDEPTLTKELQRMRAYLRSENFSETEIANTFDKRMLKVARKGSLYDEGQANKPKPVIPGKGKTLTPGTATPLGNVGRRHIDEAQNRLAKSGHLDDATDVFARLIR